MGWVFRHSPCKGATFQVHLAVADSVNDQHGNELWMAVGTLADKARVTRGTAIKAVGALVADGYLTALEPAVDDEGRPTGRPGRYRFEFPDDAPVEYESRWAARGVRGERAPSAGSGVRGERAGVSSERARVRGERAQTQENPSGTQAKPNPSLELVRADNKTDQQVVFEAWVEATGRTDRTVLSPKRDRLIRRALADYPIDDVLDAVRGWRNSPHHCGQNDRGTTYNALELLLRDAEHIEQFRDLERRGSSLSPPKGFDVTARNVAAMEREQNRGLTNGG